MRVCRTTWVLVLSELEKKIIIMEERTRHTRSAMCILQRQLPFDEHVVTQKEQSFYGLPMED